MAEELTANAPPLRRPWILRQDWLDLTFLHWSVEKDSVARFYPAGTEPDIFETRAYVGLVAFRMNTRFGPLLETNIRLYSVDTTGRRGVVFLSLDADRLDMVSTARAVFGLPYRWARMRHEAHGAHHRYTSVLRWPGVSAGSTVEVQVGGPLTIGPLAHFLTARWGLHVSRAGRTWYLPNDHPAWSLRSAELTAFEDDGLLVSVGLDQLSGRPPDYIAFSNGVPARFGLPVRATTPRPPASR